MDSANFETVVCPICGKEFERRIGKIGRKQIYCSKECKNKRDVKKTVEYLKKRYRKDEEFRERRKRTNTELLFKKRVKAKEEAMQELVADLNSATTPEEIRAILDERIRLKRETYGG